MSRDISYLHSRIFLESYNYRWEQLLTFIFKNQNGETLRSEARSKKDNYELTKDFFLYFSYEKNSYYVVL